MNPDQPQASLRTLWVLYFAFTGAAVIYAVIGKILADGAVDVPFPLPVTAALIVAAAGTLVAAYIIPRGTWAKAASQRMKDPRDALASYQTAMIMHWACLEAVAIYGLVLTVMTGQWLPSLVGTVVSLAFLATARPRPGSLGIQV